MGQKTNKSPTPSTAKKIGVELPMDSTKEVSGSLSPDALEPKERTLGGSW